MDTDPGVTVAEPGVHVPTATLVEIDTAPGVTVAVPAVHVPTAGVVATAVTITAVAKSADHAPVATVAAVLTAPGVTVASVATHDPTELVVAIDTDPGVTVAEADDQKAEALKWRRSYDVAQRVQSEAMDRAHQAVEREKWAVRQLARCGKAVGQVDPTKIAAAVEAFVRERTTAAA